MMSEARAESLTKIAFCTAARSPRSGGRGSLSGRGGAYEKHAALWSRQNGDETDQKRADDIDDKRSGRKRFAEQSRDTARAPISEQPADRGADCHAKGDQYVRSHDQPSVT